MPGNHLQLQHELLGQLMRLDKQEKHQLRFYPHQFSFLKYFLGVKTNHPLIEYHMRVDLKRGMPLRVRLQILRVTVDPKFHHF